MGRIRNTGVVSLPAVMHIEGIVRNFLGLLVFLGHISLLLSGNGEKKQRIQVVPFGCFKDG